MENTISLTKLNKDTTKALKGVAILLILFGHINLVKWGGFWGVAIFLVLSGYGINESYRKNGLENYWRKRLSTVYLPYLLITIIDIFIFRVTTTKKIIFPLLTIDYGYLLDPTMWYISFIVLWYLLFYINSIITSLIMPQNGYLNVLRCALCCLSVLAVWRINKTGAWEIGEAETKCYLLLFPAGNILSELSEIKLKKKYFIILYLFGFVVSLVFIYKNYLNGGKISNTFTLFCAGAVVFLAKIGECANLQLKSKVLSWLGEYSFAIYLVEGLILYIFRREVLGIIDFTPVYDLPLLAATFAAAYLFKRFLSDPAVKLFNKLTSR